MSKRNFRELLEARWSLDKFVCIGLDPELNKLPDHFRDQYVENTDVTVGKQFLTFCQSIVEATHSNACAYKPNVAFFESYGSQGWEAVQQIITMIHKIAPNVPVILDAKRGDIGNSNVAYVDSAFNFLKADAITVHPYLGFESLKPFLDQKDKGIFVLCRTSNPGAGEFQDLMVHGEPFYCHLARAVADRWNENGNCALVVGATYPDELSRIRGIVGSMPILIPGVGAQGGDLKRAVLAGNDSRGWGMIINSSRGIIYASGGKDFAQAAQQEVERLNGAINHCLKGD